MTRQELANKLFELYFTESYPTQYRETACRIEIDLENETNYKPHSLTIFDKVFDQKTAF